jgi:type I restriction-modification system DNA methylase subunit
VDQATHNKIVSFIWNIADDVLRDLFKRGKYSDVILPMCANGRGTPGSAVTHCDSERRG